MIVGSGAHDRRSSSGCCEDYPGPRRVPRRAARREVVAEQMDASTCLVLPSRSEGLGRVLIEAFARGRGGRGEPSRRDPGRRPRTASRDCWSTRGNVDEHRRRARPGARDRELAERSAQAAQPALPRLALDARRLRGAGALARRPHARRRPAQLDAAGLRHAGDRRRPPEPRAPRSTRCARSRRAATSVEVVTDRVRPARPAARTSPSGRSARRVAGQAARALPGRAVARALAASAGRGARAHGPGLRRARVPAGAGRGACRSCSGTRTGESTGACALATRLVRRGAQRRPALVPARLSEGPADRARDRPVAVLARGRAERRALVRRARADAAVEGARDAARAASSSPHATGSTRGSRSAGRS